MAFTGETPAWVDFVVVFGLCLMLFGLLRIVQGISNRWKAGMKKRIDDALEKRKAVKDNFRIVNGYSWDYVMVFKILKADVKLSDKQKEFSLKYILNRLSASGLQTKLFYSAQNDEVYCKIRAPLKRLYSEADRRNYKLPCDPSALANRLREGKYEKSRIPTSTLSCSIKKIN
jgi:hypothetical protein